MSLDRKLPNELTFEFIERLVQNLLEDADVLFHVLDRDTPITTVTFLGTVIDVTLKRKPYKSAAGDILEKGKVKLAELQSVKGYVKDDKVVEGKKEQGEGEPPQECSEEVDPKISRKSSEVVEIKEQKIGAWWDRVRDHWIWSGCVVDTKWEDFTQDEKDFVKEIYDSFSEVVQ